MKKAIAAMVAMAIFVAAVAAPITAEAMSAKKTVDKKITKKK